MNDFVCVRLVKANQLDLTRFQFDYDLTFAIFFMNADGEIYGRYGSRSERTNAEKDISLESLAEALRRAKRLHAVYPGNRALLAGKQPVPVKYATPDDFPSLKGRFQPTLDYQGKVVASCMHCHQVRDAQRDVFRSAGRPIPDRLLFPYPMPDVLGFQLDPQTAARVERVQAGSAAARAGLQAGDRILTLAGQPLLSLADVQWILDRAVDKGSLPAVVARGDSQVKLALPLTDGWRARTDISWRVSTWPLRRMGAGGLKLQTLTGQQRRQQGFAPDQMALLVEHVGQYGPHGAAKRAGFHKGDVLVTFDGRDTFQTEAQLLAYAAQHTRPGQEITVGVRRGRQLIELKLPMQE